MRVLVCGGRDYSDWERFNSVLDEIAGNASPKFGEIVLPPWRVMIHGGSNGADAFAHAWAQATCMKIEVYPADWDTHGKAAGPIRNSKMLSEGKPDLVIAFPGGRGTADMVRKAKAAGVKVIEVEEKTDG